VRLALAVGLLNQARKGSTAEGEKSWMHADRMSRLDRHRSERWNAENQSKHATHPHQMRKDKNNTNLVLNTK
jgi:hypothetical protein